MNQGMISKLTSVLEASLSKLSRYDEGSLIGSILSFTVSNSIEISSRIALVLNVLNRKNDQYEQKLLIRK